MATRQLAPSTSVWFLTGKKGERIAATVEGRQGGAYRIAYGDNQTRIVNRNQMVIRMPNRGGRPPKGTTVLAST